MNQRDFLLMYLVTGSVAPAVDAWLVDNPWPQGVSGGSIPWAYLHREEIPGLAPRADDAFVAFIEGKPGDSDVIVSGA